MFNGSSQYMDMSQIPVTMVNIKRAGKWILYNPPKYGMIGLSPSPYVCMEWNGNGHGNWHERNGIQCMYNIYVCVYIYIYTFFVNIYTQM